MSDEDTKGEALSEEINRAKAISEIANQIISTGALALRAKKLESDSNNPDYIPKMLEA